MDKFPKEIVLGGACILGFTLALGWGGVTMVIKGQVKKEIRLINNTDTYRAWKDFPLPLYLSIYMFNITNGDEVLTGEKPKVMEVGPYVYIEHMHKSDLSMNMTTEIICFRQLRFYYFQPDMSTGTEEDIVTIPNVPLLGLAKLADDMKDGKGDDILKTLDELLSKKEETLMKTYTVKEILFEGFPVEHYASLVKESSGDPELSAQEEPFKLPVSFVGEKFGFFRNRNGSDQGQLEIQNGRNYTWQFGQVVTYNGEEETTWWKEPCNRIKGSDGLSFHPFINTTTPLYTFEPTYCRPLSFVFNSRVVVNEVDSLRFTLSPETFKGQRSNPDNGCYCLIENSTACDRNGVYDLSPCHDGIPLLLSKPHFLEADPDIVNGVEGVTPNPEFHDSFMDMHSMSGIPLKSAKRFQFNIEMLPFNGIPAMGQVPKAIIPLFWYQESVEAGSVHFLVFKIIEWIQNGWDMVKYGLMGGGFVILLTGATVGMFRKTADPDKMVLVK